MNILLVTELFFPHIGGGEQIFLELARSMSARGHEVHVLTGKLPETDEYEEMDGFTIHRRLPTGNVFSRIRILASRKTIEEMIREHEIDIVHVNAYLPVIPAINACTKTKTAYVTSIHMILSRAWKDVKGSLMGSVQMLLEKYILSRASKKPVHLITKKQRSAVPKARDVHVIPNFIDDTELPEKVARNQEEIHAVFVGSLLPVKNILKTAQACIDAELPLHIVGDGPQKESLPKHPLITQHGRRSHEEALRIIAGADTLILYSRSEQFPLVVLEALALNTPVICSNVGNTEELQKRYPRLITIVDTYEELLEALRHVAKKNSPSRNDDILQRYAKRTVMDSYERMYAEVTFR